MKHKYRLFSTGGIALLALFMMIGGMAHAQPQEILNESLRGGSAPSGWTHPDISFEEPAGGYARFDDIAAELVTPVLDLSGYQNVTLTFDVAKWGSGGDGPLTVQVSNDGGSTWTAQQFDSPVPTDATYLTSGPTAINVSGDNVRIRWIRPDSPSRKRLRDVVISGEPAAGDGEVAIPTIVPSSGTYFEDLTVTLDVDGSNKTIYYTTNGSTPNESSQAYTGPFTVADGNGVVQLRVRAFDDTGQKDPSQVASATYTFPLNVPDIQALRSQTSDGSTLYRLANEATFTGGTGFRNTKFFQDNSGYGIQIDDPGGTITTSYSTGDNVYGLVGTLSVYQGQLQFTPEQDPGAPVSTGNEPSVVVRTLSQLSASDQARLVWIENVEFEEAGGTFGSGGTSTNITDPSISGFNGWFRNVFGESDITGADIPDGPVNITGVIQENSNGLNVSPRSLADIEDDSPPPPPPPPPAPGAIALSSPADDAVYVSVLPEFTWEAAGDADSYTMQLASDAGFDDLVAEAADLEVAEYALIDSLAWETVYFWRVRGVNEGGDGEWSAVWSFTTEEEPPPPAPDAITLSSPADEAVEVSLLPEFAWEAADDADSYTMQLASDDDFEDLVAEAADLEAAEYALSDSLDYETVYFWRVRGVNEGGEGEWSAVWSFTTEEEPPPPPPPAPGVITLSAPADEAVEVSLLPEFAWEAADDADSYTMQLASDDGFDDLVAEAADLEVAEYALSDSLSWETAYFWRVRGVNEGGEGEWSAVWRFTTEEEPPPPPPPAPGAITLSAPADDAVEVSLLPEFAWEAADDADSYTMQLATDADFAEMVAEAPGLESAGFALTDSLDYETVYFWRVRGVNDGGDGEWSAVWSFTTEEEPADQDPEPVPEPVLLLTPEDGSVEVSLLPEFAWEAADDTDSYTMQLASDADFDDLVAEVAGLEAAEYALTESLAWETTYFWRVRGVNEGGEGEWSAVWSFTTEEEPPPPPPPAPGAIALSSPADDAVDVSLLPEFAWEAADDAASYTMQLASDADFDDLVAEAAGLEVAEYALTESLDYETVYFWRVRGVNEGGEGEWSAVWSFTTEDAPIPVPEPVVLLMPENGAESIALQPPFSWEEADWADTYELEVASDNGFATPEVMVAGLEETNYTLPDELSHDRTYFWRVRGVNESGEGDWSPAWEFTTVVPTGIAGVDRPEMFELKQNYPNPFNPSTKIRYAIPEQTHVRLSVYNSLGQHIETLVDDIRGSGWYEVTFDGASLSSGIYLFRLETAGQSATRQMMLVK
ncbi:chitobiase/beta-hexosaminidase C-terminal domain-containing protein [Balneolales bacterium ANBcel1]|nr:chitobiase/beta-hexosaminidase C-terminal domain-containing protein [Balneolales bacterium ANBcel1]